MNRDERIRQKAHELWERDGRPDGLAEAHWTEAEQLVDAEGVGDEALTTTPETPVGGGLRKRSRKTPASPLADPPAPIGS